MLKKILLGTLFSLMVFNSTTSSAQIMSRDWEVHIASAACYTVSFPILYQEGFGRMKESFVAVTNRKEDGVFSEISFSSGFTDDFRVRGRVSIGNAQFNLLVQDGAGFFEFEKDQERFDELMKSGTRMHVTWTIPETGKSVTDVYSLMGYTSAKRNIDSACKPRR